MRRCKPKVRRRLKDQSVELGPFSPPRAGDEGSVVFVRPDGETTYFCAEGLCLFFGISRRKLSRMKRFWLVIRKVPYRNAGHARLSPISLFLEDFTEPILQAIEGLRGALLRNEYGTHYYLWELEYEDKE